MKLAPSPRHTMNRAQPWRNAASLIIACKDAAHKAHRTDYRVLMVKRSGSSGFFANAHVFPGGVLDAADCSRNWLSIFPPHTISDLLHSGPQPELYTSPQFEELADRVPAQLAFRLCALRETFEESGVLLVKGGKIVGEELEGWRERVCEDGARFYDMCRQLPLTPDVWALREWSNWLTPVSVNSRRFDTVFYVACVEHELTTTSDRNSEVVLSEWCDMFELDRQYRKQQVILGPPQVYEVRRLQALSSWSHLDSYSRDRRHCGLERWCPVRMDLADGVISVLPGDELYPATPDVYSEAGEHHQQVEGSVDSVRAGSKDTHRMEIRALHDINAHCTVKLKYNQISPAPPPPLSSL